MSNLIIPGKAPQYSFEKLSNDYLNYIQFGRAKPVSPTTLRTHTIRMRYLQRLLASRDVFDLSKEDGNIIRADMMKRGNKLKYISVVLSLLRAFLHYCEDELELAVLDPKKIKLPPVQAHEVKFLFPDQLKKFIDSIDKDSLYGIRMMAFVTVLLDTGMRITEALSLNRTGSVNAISIDESGKGMAIITGKGSKQRPVFFRSWSLYWIKQYLALRTDDHPALFAKHKTNAEVIRLTDEGIRRYFRLYAEKSGIPNAHPHTLRRTGATYLRSNGADIHDIQKWLGHSKIAITEAYVGTDWKSIRNSIEQYQSYGAMEFDRGASEVKEKWSKDGKWSHCIACKGVKRPHLAKGYCDACYVSLWRKKKKWTKTTTFDKVLAYGTNITNETKQADLRAEPERGIVETVGKDL